MTTTVTITESHGDVFLEVDGDRSIVEVLGILECAKVLAVEQA